MKSKTKLLLYFLGLSSFAYSQSQQTFDISTGLVNGTPSTVITSGVNDDTWMVKHPGTSTFVNSVCVNTLTPYWAVPTGCKWISPLADNANYPSSSCAVGTYTYRTTFSISTCGGILDGSIVLNKYGGDDNLYSVSINGHPHTISASFGTLQTATISIPAGEFVMGTNTIDMVLDNSSTYTGLLVNGYVQANYGSCGCGTSLATACDLGTICSKEVSQLDNSLSQYANNYNTGTGQPSKDVWFKFKPQQSGGFEISTCGSALDTYIHLLDENGVEIAYNDDQNTGGWIGTSCGGSLISMMNTKNTGKPNTPLRLIANKTYYVVMEGYSTNQGLMNLQIKTCLTCTSSGNGSNAENAIDLCVIGCGFISKEANNSNAIFSNTYGANMTEGQLSNDVWYTFTAGSGAFGLSWYMSTCGSSFDDTYIHLLNADKTHIFSNHIVNPNHSQCANSSVVGKSAITGYFDNITLDAGKTYYVVTEGYGSLTGNIKLNILTCINKPATGIEEESGSAELSLQAYPNPFSSVTTIKIQGGKADKADIEITNVNGARVYKKYNHPIGEEISLGENLPAGVYFVRINTNTETKTMKVVKLQ